MIPTCVNSKEDLCNLWAQNPQMCDDADVALFCRATCRVEVSEAQGDCVLAQDAQASALFSFEHELYQDSIGLGADAIGRGDVSIADHFIHGGVLEATAGDVVTNVEYN